MLFFVGGTEPREKETGTMNNARTALLLATSNARDIAARGHSIINFHTAILLANGLMAYGSGRRAYVLTAAGRAFLAAS